MGLLGIICAVPSYTGYIMFLHTFEVAALPAGGPLALPLPSPAAANLPHPAWFLLQGAKVISSVAGSADGYCAAPVVAVGNISAPFQFVACEKQESCEGMTAKRGSFAVVDARPWFGAANWDARTRAKCEAAAGSMKLTNSTLPGAPRVLVAVSEEGDPAGYATSRVRLGWALMAGTSLLWPCMAGLVYFVLLGFSG